MRQVRDEGVECLGLRTRTIGNCIWWLCSSFGTMNRSGLRGLIALSPSSNPKPFQLVVAMLKVAQPCALVGSGIPPPPPPALTLPGLALGVFGLDIGKAALKPHPGKGSGLRV